MQPPATSHQGHRRQSCLQSVSKGSNQCRSGPWNEICLAEAQEEVAAQQVVSMM